ncbi:hypothetical protein [Clostridium saccharoperbutylacetonicum]|uniref:hypothetical protein n=1 Tax=Clostridium saccharoperbutylacetonicum TaxID=36745 RepID=UPI0039E761A1
MTFNITFSTTSSLVPAKLDIIRSISFLRTKSNVSYCKEILSIQQLSERTFVSKSAIHRFCKKIGMDGFNG